MLIAEVTIGGRLRRLKTVKLNSRTVWVEIAHSKHIGQKPTLKQIKIKRHRFPVLVEI